MLNKPIQSGTSGEVLIQPADAAGNCIEGGNLVPGTSSDLGALISSSNLSKLRKLQAVRPKTVRYWKRELIKYNKVMFAFEALVCTCAFGAWVISGCFSRCGCFKAHAWTSNRTKDAVWQRLGAVRSSFCFHPKTASNTI